MTSLNPQEVKALIDNVGPSLGYDHTRTPVFPEDQEDVCAVSRLVEDGHSYGYDVIYLVWYDNGMKYQEIANTRGTKDYLHIENVSVQDSVVSVSFGSGGSFSGNPWEKTTQHALE